MSEKTGSFRLQVFVKMPDDNNSALVPLMISINSDRQLIFGDHMKRTDGAASLGRDLIEMIRDSLVAQKIKFEVYDAELQDGTKRPDQLRVFLYEGPGKKP